MFPQTRLRRLRGQPALRQLLQSYRVDVRDLILPLFIKAGQQLKIPIAAMPGHFQLSVDQLPAEIAEIQRLQIPGVILFGIPATKDATGSAALAANGVIQTAIQIIKQLAPELLIISDLCLCEYTDHGHCGVIQDNPQQTSCQVDNDATLPLLAAQAVSHAAAGADMIAPSGMMDGMVAAIRQGLDQAGFTHIPILSYAVKYASSFYAPFREAAEGAPREGDRRGYQMDPAANGAIREAELDLAEGADLLMVKPAHTYLDVIYRLKQRFPDVPLAAYHVSGEYAMIKAAAQRGWLNESAAMLEILTAIKRAGADFVITYYAKELAIAATAL